MKCSVGNIANLPYSERQLIVVIDDELIKATRKAEHKATADKPSGVDWSRLAQLVISQIILPRPIFILAEVAREAYLAWGRAKESGLQVMAIGKTEAQDMSFPPGHPRDGILYIGHPTLPTAYFTMAEFHRAVFEHKFCEAVELLMSLGATKIKVEHIRGWSKDFSARLTVPLGQPENNIKAEASTTSGNRSQLLYEATLSGSKSPSIPNEVVWYPHEATWQSIAKGRLKYGLNNFSLSVSYEDDYGINAGLKMAVQKAGLDLGGKFEDHQSTVWHMIGDFCGTISSESSDSYL